MVHGISRIQCNLDSFRKGGFIMSNMLLSEMDMAVLEERLESLNAQGVAATEELSGELNMSGCATGYCMAWD